MTTFLALALGFAAGIVSALFGVGGGLLFVPILSLVLGLDQQTAVATSMVAIVPVAVAGCINHGRHHHVDLRIGALVGLLAWPGAMLGALAANAVGGTALRITFVLLVLLVAQRMIRFGLSATDTAPESLLSED